MGPSSIHKRRSNGNIHSIRTIPFPRSFQIPRLQHNNIIRGRPLKTSTLSINPVGHFLLFRGRKKDVHIADGHRPKGGFVLASCEGGGGKEGGGEEEEEEEEGKGGCPLICFHECFFFLPSFPFFLSLLFLSFFFSFLLLLTVSCLPLLTQKNLKPP